jgi:integrase
MPKITKKAVDAAIPNGRDYVIWDSELPGFGLRVFASGKRSYVLQYRSLGRSRRYTIGLHGVWTPETARLEAKAQLGRIARGDNPAEEKQLDHRALTVKQLCDLYRNDLEAGLILGKGGRPKKASTIYTDLGRIKHHIVPLLGNRRVKDLTRADATKLLKDVMAGNTRVAVKTDKLRGKSIVRGGPGTASRTLGLFGAILTYAINAGIIDSNPAHGIRKPKDQVRQRRLTEADYRELGRLLGEARRDERFATTCEVIWLLALTGCRRGEILGLQWEEIDFDQSCIRLTDSKEGYSVRPVGLHVLEFLEERMPYAEGDYVFVGLRNSPVFGAFPHQWIQIFHGSTLEGITAHVLRHSFASIANDLGFTEVTIAALVGHAKGSVTGKYIHSLDSTLVMAADTIAGYIAGLLSGMKYAQTAYSFDRPARRATLDQFLTQARQPQEPCFNGSPVASELLRKTGYSESA